MNVKLINALNDLAIFDHSNLHEVRYELEDMLDLTKDMLFDQIGTFKLDHNLVISREYNNQLYQINMAYSLLIDELSKTINYENCNCN